MLMELKNDWIEKKLIQKDVKCSLRKLHVIEYLSAARFPRVKKFTGQPIHPHSTVEIHARKHQCSAQSRKRSHPALQIQLTLLCISHFPSFLKNDHTFVYIKASTPIRYEHFQKLSTSYFLNLDRPHSKAYTRWYTAIN